MSTIKKVAKSVIGLLLFAVGCSSQVGDAQKESPNVSSQALTSCSDDSECPGGFRCDQNLDMCYTDCSQGHISAVCKEGYSCDACDICVPEDERDPREPIQTPCTQDSDCPDNWGCDENLDLCYTDCSQGHMTTVCKEGYSCADPTCEDPGGCR